MAEEKADGGVEVNSDSVVLEEEIDPDYVPGEEEVVEYAKWLGMDLVQDKDLYWIAREGLMAPLPKNWKPCKTKGSEEIYYFNFLSGESTWDHPCDGYYKRLYEEEKKKKEVSLKESADTKRAKAKQDVADLLGHQQDKDGNGGGGGKKGKKSKKKASTLGAIGGGGGPAETKRVLGALGSSGASGLPLGAKPLPNLLGKSLDIAPLGMKQGLGGGTASSLDSLPLKNKLKSDLNPSITKQSTLKNTNAFKAEEKMTDDFLEDSDSDISLHQEQKRETEQCDPATNRSTSAVTKKKKNFSAQPERSESPSKATSIKPLGKSSRMSDRLQSALLSDSEEFSRSSLEHSAEEKTDTATAVHTNTSRLPSNQTLDSPDVKSTSGPGASMYANHTDDSPLPVAGVKKKLNFGGFDSKTDEVDFVKNQYADSGSSRSNTSNNDRAELEKERIALQTERESLQLQKLQLQQEKADLRLERDMVDRERTLLEKEKSVFSTERATLRRERSEAEDIREALMRDKEAFQYQKEKERMKSRVQSPIKSNTSSDSSTNSSEASKQLQEEVHRLERELEDMQRQVDTLRREKNAISAELSKMEKSLESEKQLRNASIREASESSAASHKEIEDSLTKTALLEVDKKSLESQVDQLKNQIVALKSERNNMDDEIERLKKKLSQSATAPSQSSGNESDDIAAASKLLKACLEETEESLRKRTGEISVLKNTISKLEMQVIEANEQTEKQSVKLKFTSSENSRLVDELGVVQAEKRSAKRSYEDTLDELSRLQRDSAAQSRREEEQLEEISRLRPLTQQVRELEMELTAEQSKSRRIQSEYESGLEDLADSRRRVMELQLQLEEVQLSADEHKKRLLGDRDKSQREEEFNSLSDQVSELKAKLLASNSARVDQGTLLDEAEQKCRSLQKKVQQYETQVGQLERQASMQQSNLSRNNSIESLDKINSQSNGVLLSEWQGKVSRLENKLQETEEDREALESRLQSSKKRVNEMQLQIDSLEADLASQRSKLRAKCSIEEELKEAVERLTTEVSEGKEKLNTSREQVEKLKDLEQEGRKAMRRLTDEKDSLEADRSSYMQEKQRHSVKLQALEGEVDRLQQSLTDTRSSYEDKLRAAAATVAVMATSNESVQSGRDSDSNVELAQALAELASSKSALSREQQCAREHQEKSTSLSLQLQRMEVELAQALQQQKSHNSSSSPHSPISTGSVSDVSPFAEEIKQLKEELHNERRQHHILQATHADVEFRLRRSEQCVEEWRMQVSEHDEVKATQLQKVRQYQDEILELQQRLHLAELNNNKYKSGQSDSLNGDSPSPQMVHRKQHEQAQQQQEVVQELEENHQHQMKLLQTTIEELHTDKTNLHQQLHTVKNAQLLAENQLEESNFQLKIVQQTLQNCNQRCESFEADVDRLKTERHQLLAEAADHTHLVSDLRSQVTQSLADKEALQKASDSRSSELFRLREEIRALQSQLSLAEQRVGDSQREINAIKESNRLQALANTAGSGRSGGAGSSFGGPSNGSSSPSGGDKHPLASLPVTSAMDEMRIRELRLENERLAVELSQSSSDLEAANRTIADLQQDMATLRTRLVETKQSLAAAEKQVSLKQKEVTRLYEMNSHNSKAIQLLSSSDEDITTAALTTSSPHSDLASTDMHHSSTATPLTSGGSGSNSGLKRVIDGHEEKISALQSHRLEWEQALSQQNSLVRRLEEKLKDTEEVLSYHIQHQQQQQQLQAQQQLLQLQQQPQQSMPSPPSSPKYTMARNSGGEPFGSTRPHKESRESRSPRLYQHYMSSLRGFNTHLMGGPLGGQMAMHPQHQQEGEGYMQSFAYSGENNRGGSVFMSEAEEQKFQHEYGDFGAEIDTRLQDLTFEQDEVSDEDEEEIGGGRRDREIQANAPPASSSRTGGGEGAISVLKGVLKDLIRRESRNSSGSNSRGGGSNAVFAAASSRQPETKAERFFDWKQKIRKEKTLIFNVKKALKLENVYVKQVQDNLTKQREGWKQKKEQIKKSSTDSTGSSSASSILIKSQKDLLKEEGDRLNKRATQLNDLVHQIRRTQGWVVDREKKIAELESLATSVEISPRDFNDPPEGVGGGSEGAGAEGGVDTTLSLDSHMEKMRRLEQQLEKDLTVLGGDPIPIIKNNSNKRNNTGNRNVEEYDKRHLRFDAKVAARDGGNSSRHRASAKSNDDHSNNHNQSSNRPVLQTMPLHAHPDVRGRQHQQHGEYGGFPSHQLQQHYTQHFPPSHQPPPDQQFYPQAQHYAPNQYPHHQHQQYPSHAPSFPPPPPVGITANHFAERFDKSAQQLSSFQFMSQSKASSNNENIPNMNTGSCLADSVRRGNISGKGVGGMRSIVEHRSKSAEAAESHVSWLDNLRKEISQFPHAATGTGNSAGGAGVEGFSSSYATQYSTSAGGGIESNRSSGSGGSYEAPQVYRV